MEFWRIFTYFWSSLLWHRGITIDADVLLGSSGNDDHLLWWARPDLICSGRVLSHRTIRFPWRSLGEKSAHIIALRCARFACLLTARYHTWRDSHRLLLHFRLCLNFYWCRRGAWIGIKVHNVRLLRRRQLCYLLNNLSVWSTSWLICACRCLRLLLSLLGWVRSIWILACHWWHFTQDELVLFPLLRWL